MERKTELLSPCGNFDCVKAAVNNGADAVYLGGRLFNARAYASNFDDETLEKVCDLCHSYHVKVYITVNTLYKDEEFDALSAFIGKLYSMGADGVIMQDLGAIGMVRKHFPDLPVHASTQLTANSLEDVKALEALGLKTVVLSRELNLKEISYIASNTDVRIETFIHGALCVSYSGQCLMSSVLGNRSGNRGKCAQNCRLRYELLDGGQTLAQGHLLSTKDICTLGLLPELLRTGVSSLKIEGRMKSPEYVAGVTGIYRKYLDLVYRGGEYAVDPQDIRNLQQLFNRGAFSEGYLRMHSGMDMMCPAHPKHWGVYAGKVLSYDRKKQTAGVRFDKDMVPGDGIEIRTDDEEGVGCYLNRASEAGQKVPVVIRGSIRPNLDVYQTLDKRLMDHLKARYETISRKVPVTADVSVHAGKPVRLSLSSGGVTVHTEGDIPTPAVNQPLTAEMVSAQVGKLGNTIYVPERIGADVEDGLYLNKSSLNSLKNISVDLLTEKTVSLRKHENISVIPEQIPELPCGGEKSLSVSVRTADQLECALSSPRVKIIFPEMNEILMKNIKYFIEKSHKLNKKIAVKLPRIFRDYIRTEVRGDLEDCINCGIDGFLISNPGHYQTVKDSGRNISLDWTGNVLNSHTAAFWQSLGVERVAVSPEMSREEINAMRDRSRIEVLAYGYLPLMVTHQCPVGNFAGGKRNRIYCGKRNHPEAYTLCSGSNCFRLDTDCRFCLCTITTEEPLDIREDMNFFKVDQFRLDFTTETGEETAEILKKYEVILSSPDPKCHPAPNLYDKSVL